jgi:hypothetical protein
MEIAVFHAGKLNGIENIPMIVYGGVARLPLVRAFGSSQLAITSQSATQHLRPHLRGAPVVRSITQGLVPGLSGGGPPDVAPPPGRVGRAKRRFQLAGCCIGCRGTGDGVFDNHVLMTR